MRIIALLFILTIFIATSVHAEEKVFDGWVTNDQNVTIAGNIYSVNADIDVLVLKAIDGTSNIVLLSGSSKSLGDLMLTNSESKTTDADYLTKYNITAVRTNDPTLYTHHLVVTKIKQAIEVTRSFSPNPPIIFDEVTITYTFKNTGDEDISGINYLEDVASFLTPIKYTYEGEEIRFANMRKIDRKFNLKKGETYSFNGTFKLGTISSGNYSINEGRAKYLSFGNPFTSIDSRRDLKAVEPYKLYFTGASSATYRNEFDFGFKIENTHSDNELEIEGMDIYLPVGVVALSLQNEIINQSKTTLHINAFTIGAGSSKDFSFKLRLDSPGTSTLIVDTDYRFAGYFFSGQDEKNLTSTFIAPTLSLNMTPLSTEKLRSGSPVKIKFSITNKENKPIEDLSVKVHSDVFASRNFLFKSVPASNTIFKGSLVKEFELTLPSSETDSEINVYMNASINALGGKKQYYSTSLKLPVLGGVSDELFDLVPEVYLDNSSSSMLKVSLTKLNDEYLSSSKLKISGDLITKSIELDAEELKQLEKSGSNFNLEFPIATEANKTYAILVSLDSTVDGFLTYQNFTFYVNGTDIATEIPKEENQTTQEVVVNDPFANKKEIEDSGYSFNMKHIVWSIVIIIVLTMIIATTAFLKRKNVKWSNGVGAHVGSVAFSPNESYDPLKNIPNQKKENVSLVPKPGTGGIDALEKYISESKSSGKSATDIRSELKNHGWLEDIINIYLK